MNCESGTYINKLRMGASDVGLVDGVLKRTVVVKLRRGEVIHDDKAAEHDIKKILSTYHTISINGRGQCNTIIVIGSPGKRCPVDPFWTDIILFGTKNVAWEYDLIC